MNVKEEMGRKEHYRRSVWPTAFHARTSELNILNEWHRWKDYTTADAYFDEQLEYAAIRNACAVFDLCPMTKHLITGPDALAFLNRLVTRDVAKIKPAIDEAYEKSFPVAFLVGRRPSLS